MSKFVDFFYPLPARRRTPAVVFLWWEERRVAYNLIVGATGCGTIAVTTLLLAMPGPFGASPPFTVILGVAVLYGVIANLCYFLGPLAELAMYRLWGEDAPRAGPALFRQGLIFSVGLTLFPIALAGLGLAIRVLSRLF